MRSSGIRSQVGCSDREAIEGPRGKATLTTLGKCFLHFCGTPIREQRLSLGGTGTINNWVGRKYV